MDDAEEALDRIRHPYNAVSKRIASILQQVQDRPCTADDLGPILGELREYGLETFRRGMVYAGERNTRPPPAEEPMPSVVHRSRKESGVMPATDESWEEDAKTVPIVLQKKPRRPRP